VVSGTVAQASAAARHGYLHDLGLPIMFGAIVLLVSATLLLGANITALRGNLSLMEHSQRVLDQISDLENGLLGEEMIVRGYALTGDPSFLKVQKVGAHNREAARQQLIRLMTSEPQHADRLRLLLRDIARHNEIFGQLEGNGPEKATTVARAIIDPGVRENMRRVRADLRQLRAAEFDSLRTHQRDITSQLGRAFILAVGIIITAFVLGGIGMWAAQFNHPQKR
jgi:CHASE3 domain sensor protein